MSVGVAEEAVEMFAVRVINRDLPAPGIADKQVVAEIPEVWRRKRHPRTIVEIASDSFSHPEASRLSLGSSKVRTQDR